MSDEQTIYISPEDDLTTVRERLENLSTHNVTLVIPAQTQLRSHVAWKLLYARARELGKEVLIVSSDPQVRSVAHAVKFKVAHSLETSQSGKSRPASRPTSRATKANTVNRKAPTSRTSKNIRSSNSLRPRPAEQSKTWTPPIEPETGQELDSSLYHEEQVSYVTPPLPIQPLSREQMDEEPDLLLEDYEQAQNIRLAAKGDKKPAKKSVSRPIKSKDPFAQMEEREEETPQEQRGGASLAGFDTREQYVVQDVEDYPTQMMQENLDYHEQDDYLPQAKQSPSKKPISKSLKGTGARDYSNLRKSPDPVQLPNPSRGGPKKANTRSRMSVPLRPSGTLSQPAPLRPSGSLRQQGPIRSSGSLRPANAIRPSGTLRPPGGNTKRPLPMAVSRKPTTRTNNRMGILLLFVIIFIVLGLAFAAFTIPSADVVLTVDAQTYAKTLSLNASPVSKTNEILARQITQEFRKTGKANATGTKMLGRGKAKGTVCFNNTSSIDVEIPTGTIIATESGVEFKTGADVVIPKNYSCATDAIPDPVEAVNAGDSGNVTAGSITIIPESSLDTIAKVNKTETNNLKLSVNNSQAISGGGMQPFPMVTDKDLEKARTDLRSQVQGEIDTWAKSLPKDGVISKLYTTDTLIKAPAKESVIEDGNKAFDAEVKVSAVVLFVKNEDLQRATVNQLNKELTNDAQLKNYTVVQNGAQTVKIADLKQEGKDANALKLTFKATAKAVPSLPKDQIQTVAVGKGAEDAERVIKEGFPKVQKVDIAVSPSIFPVVPFWTNRINVKFVPDEKTTAPQPTATATPKP